MTDLKSWNVINVDNLPEDVDVETLPDFGLFDGDPWCRVHRRDPVTKEWDIVPSAGDLSGWYHCTPSEVGDWAKEFTAAHPGVTVTWYEEFRMDDVGESSTVYRAGEKVVAESKTSRMVPDDLGDMLDQAKRAITAYHMPIGDEQRVIEGLVTALERLVKGLS